MRRMIIDWIILLNRREGPDLKERSSDLGPEGLNCVTDHTLRILKKSSPCNFLIVLNYT